MFNLLFFESFTGFKVNYNRYIRDKDSLDKLFFIGKIIGKSFR